MSTHDQAFRTEAAYINSAKFPCILFADQELGTAGGYANNSLEGTLFDQVPLTDGVLSLPSGGYTPNWKFYDTFGGTINTISSINISSKVCTVVCTTSTGFEIGDAVSITGVDWDSTHPFVNSTWIVKSVSTTSVSNDTFTFDIEADDNTGPAYTLLPGYAIKDSVFEIRDNRGSSDARGQSFTSIFFTPKYSLTKATGFKRVLPSDLYIRFRFQTGSDTSPKGGINSNLFSVLDDADNNIKPVLWGYFFGYSTSSLSGTDTAFQVAFNSYAIVLRPTGDGSRLEFAILKFDWGAIGNPGVSGDWMSNFIDNNLNQFEVSGTELGYLIASNPSVENSLVTELAVSDSFTYDSDFAAKFNLKITIRKHLLTDSVLDGTYLVNLMINDTYEDFGPGQHYNSILHAYITRPDPVSVLTNGVQANDLMLSPILYFKFNNTNEQFVGAPDLTADPPNPGSSKIVLDNLFYRQINSAYIPASGTTSYLY